MTHPILHQNLFPALLKQNVSRTKSSAIGLATPVLPQLPELRGKKTPLLPLPAYQSGGLAQVQTLQFNRKGLPHLVVRAHLHTAMRHPVVAVAQLGSQVNPSEGHVDQQRRWTSTNRGGYPPRLTLSEKVEPASFTLRRSPIQRDLQGRGRLPVGDQAKGGEGRVDHRLLTVKLGGWRQGSPNGEKLIHRVGVEGARQRVSFHVAPQVLPGYVIKLVNQLMRHGKKGVSVGLLADSLALFWKRLEEGRRSNLPNTLLPSANLPQQINGQGRSPFRGQGALPKEGYPFSETLWGRGPCTSEARSTMGGMAVGLQGIPSFPFYLTSFPGASFNEIFSYGKGRLNTLLGLPFSATLPVDSPWMRLSFVKREGEHRGSLGFKGLQDLGGGEGPSAPYICKMSPFSYALDTQKGTGGISKKVSRFAAWEMAYRTPSTLHQKERVDEPILRQVNPETSISGKRRVPTRTSTHASQSDASPKIEVHASQSDASPRIEVHASQSGASPRIEVGDHRVMHGLRFHTRRPTYFWPMRSPATLMSHHKSIKVEEPLPPFALQSKVDGGLHCTAMQMGAGAPRGLPRLGVAIPPQASVLSYLGQAIANVEPTLEVRKKKIAGITRQIPRVLPKSRGERLAIGWIINAARERAKKRGKGLPHCLAEELLDAYHKRGDPRQRRDSLHKLAESNRSFLRYRWW